MTIDPSLTYKIRGRQSGKCLYSTDYQGQYDCSPDGDGQNFKLEDRGDGYYRIRGKQPANKCLYSNIHGVSHYDCNDGDAQKFKLEKAGDDPREYKIYAKETQKCLYANADGRYGHGTCADYDDQRFYFVPAEYNCCFANVERKGAATTIEYGLQCDSKHTDPGGTACTNIYSNYCKVGDRVITDSKCKALKNSNITLFNQIMGDKCQLDDFYKTTECIAWCKENSTKCEKLNTETSCKEFEIPTSECTSQKVLDLKTDCQKYGVRSEQGLSVYKCSPAGIKALTDQCKEYDILESCTPSALQDAIDNATRAAQLEMTAQTQTAQLEMAAQTQEQIQKNYDTTRKTIADILDLTEEPAEPAATTIPALTSINLDTVNTWIKNNYTMFMIIIAIVVLIICSSSSVSALLLLKKKLNPKKIKKAFFDFTFFKVNFNLHTL